MENDAQRVREARKTRGWTQEDLARKAGCDVRTIRRLESGRAVSPKVLSEIDGAFNKTQTNRTSGETIMSETFELVASAAPSVDAEAPLAKAPEEPRPAKPRAEETREKLTMGYEVVSFLERFPDAELYVLWDTDDQDLRKVFRDFIKSGLEVQRAVNRRGFSAEERFEAQCYFADNLSVIHKAGWNVTGLIQRERRDDDRSRTTFAAMIIDLRMPI